MRTARLETELRSVAGKTKTPPPLRNLPHHVFTAEGIRRAENAFGIIVPLAIHEEPVMVRARLQIHRGPPHPVHAFMQIDGTFLPLGEVAHQLHTHCVRRAEREGLFPGIAANFRVCSFCHNFPFQRPQTRRFAAPWLRCKNVLPTASPLPRQRWHGAGSTVSRVFRPLHAVATEAAAA